jgi:heat shock protein HslJ
LTHVIGRTDPHLLLTGQGDSLTYSATVGCNGIGGKATRTGDEIAFGVGTGTMMSCGAALDSLERRLIGALTQTVSWRVLGNTLEFKDENGTPAILFDAAKHR